MNALLKPLILSKINTAGGWVNTHAHFDRAYTVNPELLSQAHALMEEKWTLSDDVRKSSSEEDYAERIEKAVQVMIAQGVTACSTFIDVDQLTELRAMKAAVSVKKKYQGIIRLVLMNQTSKGLADEKTKELNYKALEYVDIIGGLPSKDRPHSDKQLDTLFSWAKETKKMVHIHIDQENNPEEHDIDLLCNKTKEYGLEGKVVAVHAISVAAQPKEKRKEIYKKMKSVGLIVVCCPSAALSMRPLPYTAEIHNSIVPVPELLEAGVSVSLGVDNVSDIFQPLVDGDMYTELRFLAEACRFYDIDKLVDIATIHGKKALGI